ncbi:MAG: alpha/beta fold hydrolase [Bacteroidales bacterium]|jgi:pimeloyl-ACP methyl ester carboxylesterase|nr:alpha/beta fold hydrolase [Bacteroidales bacterium]HOC49120.1 alpha/beta fold hydrolase [Bacteroidales bacterium]HPS97781.1 alpha/beta fold hydrolase [Bacteroidales bacterium]
MKSKPTLRTLLLLALPLLMMQSCRKDDPVDPFADNTYLVSSDLKLVRTKENIISVLTIAATQYQAAGEIIPDVVSGVNVYAVTYNTEFMGEPVVASGLICAPTTPGTYPILSFQNGTNTLHSAAPTADPQNLGYQMIEYVASAGYVVIMPDYLGFGASSAMVHPYLHKESTVQAVLDMLRAVAEFDDDVAKDISVTTDCYLLGYSQGGWATMALLRAIDEDYSSEFTVKAASCGAGPYDLRYFNTEVTRLTEYPMPVFLGYIANAYTTYDLYQNELTDLFNSQYASVIPGLYDGQHSSEQINSQLTTSISGLFTAEYLSGAETDQKYLGIRNALRDNSINGWDCDVPLLLLHGTADTYVMPGISQSQYNIMIGSGTSPLTCFYVPLEGLDHSQASVPALFAGYEFFKEYR